jgi:hypothetical protein
MLRPIQSLVPAIALLAYVASASAAVIHVDASAPPGGDGSTWAAARNDLRQALAAAATGDQVWIARGIYIPTTTADRTIRFSVPRGVIVLGGFAGDETDPSQRPEDPDPAAADPATDTILSGEIGAPGTGDNTMLIVELPAPTVGTRLERLVITSGTNESGRGGGMRIAHGSAIVSECLFINNQAGEGGALWLDNSPASLIENCHFTANTAASGGAIVTMFSALTVRFTRFESNSSTSSGGAVVNTFGGGGVYENCDFIDNATGGDGGGAIASLGQPTPFSLALTDCTFTNCGASTAPVAGKGGALYSNGAGSMIATRCVFDACTADQGGATNDQGGHVTEYRECVFRNGVGGFGGAALFYNPASFVACLFDNCAATSAGGAVMVSGAGTFDACEFRSNRVTAGTNNGGAAYLSSPATFADCDFIQNTTSAGGAIYMAGSAHTFDRCRFDANAATGSGGAFFSSGASSAAFINSLFTANSSGFYGAVGTTSSGPVSLINCTLAGNTAPQFVVRAFSAVTIANCIVTNPGNELSGSLTVSYSNVQGGFTGAGNIDADPLFADPAMGDYSLLPASPCIDAGDNAAVPPAIVADHAGMTRFVDDPSAPDTGVGPAPVIDMGAYEVQAPPAHCPGDADGNGEVNFADITSVLTHFNTATTPGGPGDANADGVVDFSDVTSVLTNWGSDCT